MTKRLNRKQRAGLRREQRSVLTEEKFFTSCWTIDDWAKVPRASDGWTAKPDRERFFIVRVRAIRFSDGTSRRFYLQVAKPETLHELRQLQDAVKELVRETRQTLTSAICNKERLLIKQPYRPRKKAKR